VVGGIHLADGVEFKAVTGIDDNSRFIVSAMLVARATARRVCEALRGHVTRYLGHVRREAHPGREMPRFETGNRQNFKPCE
jgi:hypothetical protein